MNTITLKKLHLYSKDEVFNYIASSMLKEEGVQKFRYRNPKSTGVGCVISDSEYSPEFEGKCWDILIEYKQVPSDHSFIIASLQRIQMYEKNLKQAIKHFADRTGVLFSE